MEKLIHFLIHEITGSTNFEIKETEDERGSVYSIKADPSIIGLIIGKQGATIKNIRRIAAIKAALEKKYINIAIETDSVDH